MNFKLLFSLFLLTFSLLFITCKSQSFEDQIKNDITSRMATGICDSIPKGSTISNIKIGKITDIGLQGMTDVAIEFDHQSNGPKKHFDSAMLYIKDGNSYKLASMGHCKFEMK